MGNAIKFLEPLEEGLLERRKGNMAKNFELLGRQWDYYKPLAELLKELRQEGEIAYSCPLRSGYQIKRKLMYPALAHLGFGPVEEVAYHVERGVDMAIEYFLGDWWQPESINRIPDEELLRMRFSDRARLIDESSRAIDKSRPDRKLQWYEGYRSVLFLAGLAGRWDDLAKISSWFDATIEPEYQAGQIEDEYQQLFLCIAGSLAPEPMADAERLLAKVKKCRTKRPRLLCAAWEAANAADQAAFNKAFPETVKQFLSKPEGGQAYDWLAIDQSSVWLIAEHRGLKFPALSEKQQPAVVTRQSIGLAD